MLGESEGEDLGDSFAHPLFLALEPNPIERHDHDDPELRIGVYLARSGQRQDTHQGCDDPRPPAESTHHGTSFLRRPRRTSMATRANAPGPTRRRAISGTSNSATRPTSPGHTSTAMRDCRRAVENAS